MGPYHRLKSPTQTLADTQRQEATGRICGKTHRGGSVPSVKAYVGPLPAGAEGVEFTTDVPPFPGTAPHLALWRRGSPGVEDFEDEDMVCIRIAMMKNTQVP
jgi:hypothetical protein